MSHSKEEILIDYLDNRLEGAARLEAEQLINEDATAAAEMENLAFSVDLIREASVLEQVMDVRKEFAATAKVVPFQKKQGGVVVHSFGKNLMRIAAMVLLLLGAGGVYKYAATTSSSVYNESFVSFDLETS